MKSNKQQLFLGIDGGGSKCKAVLLNNSMQVLGEGISGAANPFHNLELAQQSINRATDLALVDASLDISLKSELIAGIGLAGVNLPKYYDLMQQWQHPFKSMHLATDLHIACLGAHGGEDGAIIITGTGSCGYVTNKDKSLVIGGHGFPHGDVCSGAWLGFKAVEKVLLSFDEIINETSLTEKLFGELACVDANSLIETIAGNGATFYAKLANHVFDAADSGDTVAKDIINEGCQYFEAVFTKLMARNPSRLSLIGGLKPRLLHWLPPAVANQISEPDNPPEIGAVLFAMREQKI